MMQADDHFDWLDPCREGSLFSKAKENATLLVRTLDVIGLTWVYALLGTGLMLIGTGLGWSLARDDARLIVRPIAWWIRKVARPLLRSRSWWRRTATIFVNNVSILAAVVAAGWWSPAAMLAVAGLGVSLGIGLRLLLDVPDAPGSHVLNLEKWARRGVAVGVGLNLLEPPAIMLAIGLSLGQGPAQIASEVVWETFAAWVIPLMLIAAAGESLWLGVYRGISDRTASTEPTSNGSELDPPEDG